MNNGAAGLQFGPLMIALAIVATLLAMLVYLIALRAIRIKAEAWLEKNRHIIFSHAKNLKSDEELLEAILNSPRLQGNGVGGQTTPT